MITKNKSLFFCVDKQKEWSYFDLRLELSNKKFKDHAGFYFYIELFGYYIDFNIYDDNHNNN